MRVVIQRVKKANVHIDGKKISEIEKVPCELKNIIDATIIGGVKVAINGHVYDGSIANKIEQMRLTLNK